MNISKYIAFAAVAAAASGAFAVGVEIGYSTKSTAMDRYADGTLVAKGEWYMLAWSADDVFAGITPDYKAIGADDEVLIVQKTYRADDFGFYTVFEIKDPSQAKKSGKYFVIPLDTRDDAGNPAPETFEGSGVPTRNAKAAMASASFVPVSAGLLGGTGTQTVVANGSWGSTATPTTEARIAKINVDGNTVMITVEGMSEGVRYNVKSGDTPSAVSKYEIAKPEQATSETKKIEITVEEGTNAKFFKLTPEPMARPNAE